jgi:hypothetical protein
MKKAVTLTSLLLTTVIILDTFGVWHALFMFYLAGEIPGTRRSVSANFMMELFALLFGFVVARITSRATSPLFAKLTFKHIEKRAA